MKFDLVQSSCNIKDSSQSGKAIAYAMFSECILSLKTSALIKTQFLSASPNPSPQKSALRKGGSRPPLLPPRSYKPPFSPDLDKLQEVLHIEQKPITPGYFQNSQHDALVNDPYISRFLCCLWNFEDGMLLWNQLSFSYYMYQYVKLAINFYIYCMFPI